MTRSQRIVLDTNALVSRLLFPASVPGLVVDRALAESHLLISEAVMEELTDVLSRPKFDRYIDVSDRQGFLRRLARMAEWVPIVQVIRACRDPRDDKFLELAINGEADLIVTGDADLLALHPFRRIPILAPAAYLAR